MKDKIETAPQMTASPSPGGEGRGEGEPPSQTPSASSAVKENPQSQIPDPKSRQDALDEAAKLCGDLRNSVEAILAYAITGHTDVVRQHYSIYVDRVKTLHTLLSGIIENLPEL
jgi:hypothetical protein